MTEKEIDRLSRLQWENDKQILRELVTWYLENRPTVFEMRQQLDRRGYSTILVSDFARLAEVAGMFGEGKQC